MTRTFSRTLALALASALVGSLPACVQQSPGSVGRATFTSIHRTGQSDDQILRGREVVINHDCAGCHNGVDPNSSNWLAGMTGPEGEFMIGACTGHPGAKPCWLTRPRNLTPDNATGIGRFTERQIFNALKWGLRPEDTPDIEITSNVPGQGNFPLHPHYLAPPMPWNAWRHMPDQDLYAIAAYLKRAVKPVVNKVAESEGPPDFWASTYTEANIGPLVTPAFPAKNERVP